ncbi:MAG: hypothetical protein KBT82_08065 [Marinobacter sp.]|uniref:hypothetical protein n=1 Tax=Marinobacter sp. TaxID=50741 RepID=UPI001B70C644|nr:hypothetical protein [Marinobacter sp.]MBQ0747521.1 hypothetical protein [Marinobacter sp.]MBQ0814115.1 hypothetical protein [Marinobacter sp.]|tara:strand:- start:151 stop:786 length:636 start_codon:yes stop_codon:yes gene_type:complete
MTDDLISIEGQDSVSLNRRSFLRTGLGGALFLGTVSVTAGLSGCATAPASRLGAVATRMDARYQFRFLTTEDVDLFEALLPAILGSALPEQPNARRMMIAGTVERIDAGIYKFGPANQKELRQLFDLLNFGPTRVTIARVWPSWRNASTAQADAFLERWRSSSIGLFNNGYMALTKISNVAFYGYQENWHLSGYPGPPEWAVQALPQFRNA